MSVALALLDYANVLADFNEMSHEEWQEQRKKQITLGGSDAGTILGFNNFKDPYTLYLEKIGELPPGSVGEAAEWGNRLEAIVADKFLEKNPTYTIEEFKFLLQSHEYPFMTGNMDRLIRNQFGGLGILEVKTASEYLKGEWENGSIYANGSGDGKVPPKYYAQLQHYFIVTGLDWGFFACLVGGNKYCQVYVERNDSFCQMLIEQEMLFNQRIELRIAPELDGSDSASKLVSALFPEANEEVVELDVDFGSWIIERENLKAQVKELNTALNELENKIKNSIGENHGGTHEGWTATWSNRKGKEGVDLKLLKEKYPDVFEEVKKVGAPFRVLTVKKPKGVA